MEGVGGACEEAVHEAEGEGRFRGELGRSRGDMARTRKPYMRRRARSRPAAPWKATRKPPRRRGALGAIGLGLG